MSSSADGPQFFHTARRAVAALASGTDQDALDVLGCPELGELQFVAWALTKTLVHVGSSGEVWSVERVLELLDAHVGEAA